MTPRRYFRIELVLVEYNAESEIDWQVRKEAPLAICVEESDAKSVYSTIERMLGHE